jgi:hypothetical protein
MIKGAQGDGAWDGIRAVVTDTMKISRHSSMMNGANDKIIRVIDFSCLSI